MLDLDTYNRTRDLPGGPIVVSKPLTIDQPLDEPITTGVLIGRILGLIIVVGLGIYTYFVF
jgi:hypothetical protein